MLRKILTAATMASSNTLTTAASISASDVLPFPTSSRIPSLNNTLPLQRDENNNTPSLPPVKDAVSLQRNDFAPVTVTAVSGRQMNLLAIPNVRREYSRKPNFSTSVSAPWLYPACRRLKLSILRSPPPQRFPRRFEAPEIRRKPSKYSAKLNQLIRLN